MMCFIVPMTFLSVSRVSSSEESLLSVGLFALPSLLALFVGIGLVIVHFATRTTTNGEHAESFEEFDDVAELEQSDFKVPPER
jgi:hypothetical protein